MKTRSLILLAFLLGATLSSQAQRINVRLGFPTGMSLRATGAPPFSGAVWIGPEWQWRSGRYVAVPGYWARPRHPRAVWVPGHWKNSRRGYIWVPGRWR